MNPEVSDVFSVTNNNVPRFTYSKFGKFLQRLYFRETLLSFVKIKSSHNCKITLLLTDVGKLCPCHEILTLQIKLFNKIEF